MGHIQNIHTALPGTPRTEQAINDASQLRTWVGRSALLSQRMLEMERELNSLREIVQHRHPIHDEGDGKCELCDVLYPVGGSL